MTNILKEIDKVRNKIKKGVSNKMMQQKPFAQGMYRFSMFMIDYYSRIKKELGLDYDSFMIVQTVVSHTLYHFGKNKDGSSYLDLEREWEKLLNAGFIEKKYDDKYKSIFRLTISSICLVTGLPKETVRRKVNELDKKNILRISQKNGIVLGKDYTKIFQDFVPKTTLQVSKLVKGWERSGILKSILNFEE